MKITDSHFAALEKLAYFGQPLWSTTGSETGSSTVGISNPSPSVADVLKYIGVAQARDIGTMDERRDAFGRIINSGLVSTSPAGNALRMIGGGILGRAITGAFTNNGFLKGLGAGFGAVSAINKY